MAEQILVRLVANASKYISEVDKAERQTKKLGKEATGIKGKFQSVGPAAKAAFATVGLAAVAGIADATRAATDLGESINAVNKVFGEASDVVLAYGKNAAQTAGLATSQFNQLAAQTGAGLRNFGLSAQQAGIESIKLTQRAADLASIFNTDVNDALLAVQAGLRGETEPLRRFGVSLDDASLRAKAVELGLADTTKEVDRNAKAVAALELIYEQTNSAAGDFAQTSGDLANATRIAAAEWENAKASFGQAFTPVATEGVNFLTDAILAFRSIAGDETATANIRLREALENINDTAREGGDVYTALADSIFHFAEAADLGVGEFLSLASAAGLNVDQFEAFRDIVVEQARALGKDEETIQEFIDAINEAGGSAADAVEPTEDLTDETEELAKASKKAEEAQRNLAEELRSQADPVFRAARALQDYQEKLVAVDEDGKRTAEELLELASAALDSEAALAELAQGDLQSGINAIATALGFSTSEAQSLLVELGLLDGAKVTSVVEVQYTETGQLPPLVQAELDAANVRLNLTGTGVELRQHGGPVRPGRPYIVGEAGPELLIPSTAGTVVPGIPTGSSSITINVDRPQTSDLASDLAYGAMLAGLIGEVAG